MLDSVMDAVPGSTMSPSERDVFLRDAMAGLLASPKRLPGKYLWDETGSILFDRICDHADYYPTGCERALLPRVARGIADLVGPGATIVEFGSGASRKIRTLFDALDRPARYVAIDISQQYLEASVGRLRPDYPAIEMITLCADYSGPVRLPIVPDGPVLGFFPGTTIGNSLPHEAEALLARTRETLGPSRFLIGADPTQDAESLLRAYGGCDGLMPVFHLNVLERLRRELGAEIDDDVFAHEARILRDPFRMEAHLVAARPTTWRLGGKTIAFAAGESLRTDTSHKYEPKAFRALAERAGWVAERLWLDPDERFGLHLLRA